MTFTEDIRFEGQHELHRGPPLVDLAPPSRVERSVHVLSKEHAALAVVDVQYDTAGGVAGSVQVVKGLAADGHGSSVAGESDVDGAGLQGHSIDLGGSNDWVGLGDGARRRLVSCDFAAEPGTDAGCAPDVVDVLVREYEEDDVFWLQPELGGVTKDSVDAATGTSIDEDERSSEVYDVDVAVADVAGVGSSHAVGVTGDPNGCALHRCLPQDCELLKIGQS